MGRQEAAQGGNRHFQGVAQHANGGNPFSEGRDGGMMHVPFLLCWPPSRRLPASLRFGVFAWSRFVLVVGVLCIVRRDRQSAGLAVAALSLEANCSTMRSRRSSSGLRHPAA